MTMVMPATGITFEGREVDAAAKQANEKTDQLTPGRFKEKWALLDLNQ